MSVLSDLWNDSSVEEIWVSTGDVVVHRDGAARRDLAPEHELRAMVERLAARRGGDDD